jgi:Cu2+-exporting ATPase
MTCCALKPTALELDALGAGTGDALSQERNQALMAQARRLEPDRDGSDQAAERWQLDLLVPGMHCASCIQTLERGLGQLAGVESARANLSLKRLRVVWQPAQRSALSLVQAVEALGYEAQALDLEGQTGSQDPEGRHLLIALGVAGFAASNVMLMSVANWSGTDQATNQLFHLISGLIAIPATAVSGRVFFASAWRALRKAQLNMDVPISLAILLALGLSLYEALTGGQHAYFDAALSLMFFLLVGRYLDHLMRRRALGAVASLSRMAARTARSVDEAGHVTVVPVDEVQPGQRLRVRAGDRLPVDARVLSGASDLDLSIVSGESEPIAASPGQELQAGVLVLNGSLELQASSTAQTSFMAEIMAMMEAAEQGKGAYVRLADRVARLYAPAVHALAAAAFLGWLVATQGDWYQALYVAIAVLIITCPCALGLAVPVAQVVASARLFKNGVMVKEGSAIERLAEVDRIVLDKTGTLTKAEPRALPLSQQPGQLPLIKTLAEASHHPAARALARLLEAQEGEPLQDLREVPGLGMEARWRDQRLRLGRPEWVAEIAPGTPGDQPLLAEAQLAFGVEGQGGSAYRLDQDLTEGAGLAMNWLQAQGYAPAILSGDRDFAVKAVAQALEITDWQAQLSPADKAAALDDLGAAGHKVLMVGDGLNDAPALARGHASIAAAAASDVGRAAADVVLTRQSLASLPLVLELSRKTRRVIQQNFMIALAYNCVAVPLAVMGLVTPLIAAVAMSSSSIVVVANAMRLSWMRAGLKQTGAPANPVAQGTAVKPAAPAPRLEPGMAGQVGS